jgi:Peptidase family M23
MRSRLLIIFGVLGFGCTQQVIAEDRPQLSLPLACEPHKTCFIQNYVDDDPGAGVRDYHCGGASYDGHTGTDFRLLSAEAVKSGVAVLAAAAGTVTSKSEGVKDQLTGNGGGITPDVRKCGNSVTIDHGSGWETQYCHMRAGSVAVQTGQAVKTGERLGDIGFSGAADFAHVHLTVKHNGKVIDPFNPEAVNAGDTCKPQLSSATLWTADVAAAFANPAGDVLGVGFAGEPPDFKVLETDHTGILALTPLSPALLFYGRFMNLRVGDRVKFTIRTPGGNVDEKLSQPLDKKKATYLGYAGIKRGAAPWPHGRYEGRVEVMRDGAAVLTANSLFDLK